MSAPDAPRRLNRLMVGLGGALVIGLVALVSWAAIEPVGRSTSAASPSTASGSATTPGGAAATSPAAGSSTSASTASAAAGVSDATGEGSATPGAGVSKPATEVLPPAPPTGLPLAPSATVGPAGPRLTMPLPATTSARGALVAGFPVKIVPVPAGATVVSSSVSAEGSRLQVGLEASTAASPADVQAGYVQALTATGFITTDSPAGAGATATAFVRDNDGLVLTLRERVGGGTELSVAGTLTAQG